MGEVGLALVVPTPGSDPNETREELVAWAKARLANYKLPRRVEVVESFPMNAGGKVLKRELRVRYSSTD
jgi:acyl-CoA synthetase (AMP-forming)/AMP-acid ligase II